MRFRKLRIAWSMACCIACALFIVLWVRSYSSSDNFPDPQFESGSFAIYSTEGVLRSVEAMWIEYAPPTDHIVSYYIPSRFQSIDGGFAITANEGLWGFN